MEGLDHSVYQCNTWTEAGVRAYRNKGYQLAWPGVWHGSSHNHCAKGNLQFYQAEGWVTGTYIVTGYGTMPSIAVDTSYDVLGKQVWDKLQFVAIDLESANSVEAVLEMENRILAKGQRPCLYSANWVFENGLVSGDVSRLYHLPLIYASYGSPKSLTPPSWQVHMTAFPHIVGHQYANTHTEPPAGFDIDSNFFDRAWVEDNSWRNMDEEQLKNLTRRVVDLERFNGAAAILRRGAAAFERKERPDDETVRQIRWLIR